MKLMQMKRLQTKLTVGGALIVALASGCGPRLRHADAPAKAGELPDAPVAKISVQYEDAKLDAEHKYTQDGEFKVGGLFYKDGEAKDATVKVALKTVEGGTVIRLYDFDLAQLAGTVAKVEMWDDGFLTVAIPEGETPKPGFQTSNANIKAAALEIPGQAPSTCYFGKEILDGQIRFALCELQTESPRLAFVDAVPEATGTAPAAEPAAAPEGEAAPKAN